MNDPASLPPPEGPEDLYDVDLPEAKAPTGPKTQPAGAPGDGRPRRPQRAAAPPPPFKVPQPNLLDLIKTHAARAFTLDGGPVRLVTDEQRTFEVTRPPVGTEFLSRVLLWRRATLSLAAILVGLTLVLDLTRTLMTFGSLGGPALFAELLLLGGLGLFGFTVWKALTGWDTWARHRRLLLHGWATALAVSLACALPRGSSLYVFAFGPVLVGSSLGLVRMAAFAKAMFPGARSPGWILTYAWPLHAAVAFAALAMTWQLLGSAVYLLGALSVAAIPLFHWREARALRRPTTQDDVVARLGAARTKAWLLGGMAALYYVLGGFLALEAAGLLATFAALSLFGAVLFVSSVVAFDLWVDLQQRLSDETRANGVAELARAHGQAWSAFKADAALEDERAANLPGGAP